MDKGYRSYLLRLWQTSDDGELIWRASLETPGTRQRVGFATLRDLCEFLTAQTAAPSESDGRAQPPGGEEGRR